jgi:hypothetical protein
LITKGGNLLRKADYLCNSKSKTAMSQQEFDDFKQRIKDWMDSHPEEYNCFVGEMNVNSDEGYQQILNTAFALVPKYKKTLTKKINEGEDSGERVPVVSL